MSKQLTREALDEQQKSKVENEFSKWWETVTKKGTWKILERMAAHDAWIECYRRCNQ